MKSENLCRQVFVKRLQKICRDVKKGCPKINESPFFGTLRIIIIFTLFEKVCDIFIKDHMYIYNKQMWECVMDRVWPTEECKCTSKRRNY